LKRSLRIVDDSSESTTKTPSIVTIEGQLISVVDTGDGVASDRFADALLEAGAAGMAPSGDAPPDLCIVIRGTPTSPEARLRAKVLEEAADVVLGSPRPAFARYFGLVCARCVNS
jgi:hypothetical protein